MGAGRLPADREVRAALRLALAVVCLLQFEAPAWAQSAPPARFGIADNSFLVEEAFNQERGIFQNIVLFTRGKDGAFDIAFTQEWPIRSQRHQLSYTIPGGAVSGSGFMGDVLINYRWQAAMEDGHPAFSPRVSLILPTSAERRPLGTGGVGWQVNLPFSKQAGHAYFHWNAGATFQQLDASGDWGRSGFLAGSVILALRPMVHAMLETVVASDETGTGRSRTVTVVPGLRTGWNIGEQQVVLGAGVQITRGDERHVAALGYFSYELPFSKSR